MKGLCRNRLWASSSEAMRVWLPSVETIRIGRSAQRGLARIRRIISSPSITVVFNTVAEEIEGTNKVEKVRLRNLATGEVWEQPFEAVFIFVGSDPTTGMVPVAILDENKYIVTDERMETSIPGLFAAGDVRVSPFRQVVTSCSDGAIAAHAASQYIDEKRGAAYR